MQLSCPALKYIGSFNFQYSQFSGRFYLQYSQYRASFKLQYSQYVGSFNPQCRALHSVETPLISNIHSIEAALISSALEDLMIAGAADNLRYRFYLLLLQICLQDRTRACYFECLQQNGVSANNMFA